MDSAASLRQFVDHWAPQVLIWVGGSPSPLLSGASMTRLLVDLTASDILATPGRWMPGMRRSLFSLFDHAITIDEEAAAALRKMGVDDGRIEPLGALADSQPVLPCNERDRTALASAIGARPVWLAADCRAEDYDLVIAAHKQALRRSHRLLLLLDLAEPGDATGIMGRLREAGLDAEQRSDGGEPVDGTQVYLVDTTDELGLWYRLAP
ncbi:MAG: hypothetical protein HC814_05350 [Rhodobacteraceae bacterium]|nr:hypothetical protein [Paracoccaceae bacterium]